MNVTAIPMDWDLHPFIDVYQPVQTGAYSFTDSDTSYESDQERGEEP